ncbi:SnoaL-like domain-containing protein [Cladophialophora immunda]|nr:SnoaL-like domain-containing protein [Cladophialophora immunda]
MDDYREYARIFNTGNDELLVSTFFSFPFTFTTPFEDKTYQTKEEFLSALNFYHRVRECIQPREILRGQQKLFVDLVIVFHSCVEWLDFAYGPVQPGDMRTTRAFVLYTLNEHSRIVHVEEMYGTAANLSPPIRRLGGSDTQRAAVDALIAGFNAGRFEAVGEYYTEDAVVEYPPAQIFTGRKQIVDGFKETAKAMKVTFEILRVICDDASICLTLLESFDAVADAPSFAAKMVNQGGPTSRKILILIDLEHGLISRSKSILVN